MPLKIILIFGKSNTGKSTLVRSLTGIRAGSMNHPSRLNIHLLSWLLPQGQEDCKTFCLMSSLNEGPRYGRDVLHALSTKVYNTVAPWHLQGLLDLYDDEDEFKCGRAILCINSDNRHLNWTSQDYTNAVATLRKHTVTHCISLAESISLAETPIVTITGAVNLTVPVAPHPRNQVAALVRQRIGLV